MALPARDARRRMLRQPGMTDGSKGRKDGFHGGNDIKVSFKILILAVIAAVALLSVGYTGTACSTRRITA